MLTQSGGKRRGQILKGKGKSMCEDAKVEQFVAGSRGGDQPCVRNGAQAEAGEKRKSASSRTEAASLEPGGNVEAFNGM